MSATPRPGTGGNWGSSNRNRRESWAGKRFCCRWSLPVLEVLSVGSRFPHRKGSPGRPAEGPLGSRYPCPRVRHTRVDAREGEVGGRGAAGVSSGRCGRSAATRKDWKALLTVTAGLVCLRGLPHVPETTQGHGSCRRHSPVSSSLETNSLLACTPSRCCGVKAESGDQCGEDRDPRSELRESGTDGSGVGAETDRVSDGNDESLPHFGWGRPVGTHGLRSPSRYGPTRGLCRHLPVGNRGVPTLRARAPWSGGA